MNQNTKEQLLTHFESLAKVASSIGMETFSNQIKTGRIPKIKEERFHLVVLGEFNHGKSTFVNALLGASVLPMGITPTTAALNHITFGETPQAKVIKNDGEQKTLNMNEIADWVTVAGGQSDDIHHVEIQYPSELLKDQVTLVDTPGVNDLNEQRADITYGYVPRADAVIFLLDASQALKESEREFLSSHILKAAKDRLTFVLGKTDLLSPTDLEDVKSYVQSGLKRIMDDPKVFPLSAKLWLEHQDSNSGVPELLNHLKNALTVDKRSILIHNAAIDGERSATYLSQNLGIKLQALDLDEKALDERIADVKAQLNESKRNVEQLHQRIRAEASAIKSQAAIDLEDFGRRFAEVLPEQIDRVDADHVKQFLGPFIGDTFREWAELEGANIAHLCERLAEDIIKVTNENLASASKQLASRVDSANTAVSINVDSFKYDVGVYALGAIGTTVLMFVNTLAGGLLTLAAPILAIVVKSKVSGNIKEQAKEKAPSVIIKATQSMAPHFAECIDGFSDRLCDFVTAAGTSLYQGISEVLEHTIAVKNSKGESLDEDKKVTQAQMENILTIQQSFQAIQKKCTSMSHSALD